MKIRLQEISRTLFALALVLASATLVAQAQTRTREEDEPRLQNREEHFISARAGGVNLVSGDVTFKHAEANEWRRLSFKHNLSSGDVVRTGADGHVEVLLNPGSYIRLAENSEFELTEGALDDLQLRITKGSAVIEATGYERSELLIAVETPQGRASIVRSGVYRFNVLPSNVAELFVWRGRARVGAGEGTLVKGGMVARIGGTASGVEVAKFDKKNRDAFDLWSKDRAKELAQANQRLAQRNASTLGLRNALAGWRFNSRFPFSGLWVYSAASNCYTFLPFYVGWNSPYGADYTSSFGWYYPPTPGAGCINCMPGAGNPGYQGGGGMAGGGNPGYPPGGGNGGGLPAPPPSVTSGGHEPRPEMGGGGGGGRGDSPRMDDRPRDRP